MTDMDLPKPEQVVGQVHAPLRYTPQDVHAAAASSRHPSTISCIFKKEVGGYGYDPYVTHGQAGVYGPAGLASFGLLPDFNRRGYTDVNNPYQVAAYVDIILDQPGGYRNWPYLSSNSSTC